MNDMRLKRASCPLSGLADKGKSRQGPRTKVDEQEKKAKKQAPIFTFLQAC